MFKRIIFICTFINSSLKILSDDEEEEPVHRPDVANKQNGIMEKFLYRIMGRIKLFLRVRHQKPIYLIWLIFDFFLGFYYLLNSMVYAYGNKDFIVMLEQQNLTRDYYINYRFSLMGNRITTLVLIETYFLRIRNLSIAMRNKYRHGQHDMVEETMTYFANLKLTLRAWLYILGATDQVRSRDKVYYRKIATKQNLPKFQSLTSPSPVQCELSERRNVSPFNHDSIELNNVNRISQSLGSEIHADAEIPDSCLHNSRETIHKRGLFEFGDDFQEINYQLQFPKKLFKNGNPHLLDKAALRILFYISFFIPFIVVGSMIITLRYSLAIELNGCHNSTEIFLKKHLFRYILMLVALANCAIQVADIGTFILCCFVCCNKLKHTMKFISKVVKLHECHNYWKKTYASITSSAYYNNIKRNTSKNGSIKSIIVVKNAIGNKENKKEPQNDRLIGQDAEPVLKEDGIDLIDLSMNIDKLIKMIIETRSDLDELKRHFTIYLHLEFIFKMPCIVLTVAYILKMPELDELHIVMMFFISVCYWLPIMVTCYNVSLIHSEVTVMIYFFLINHHPEFNSHYSIPL